MRFLITGTAGFIGFHLAKRLLEAGHQVVGFDGMTPYYDVRLKEARHAILKSFAAFSPVVGQLEDAQALAAAAALAEPEVIVHLAAQAGVRYSLENPKAYVDSNLVGTWNVLEVAKQWQVRHLLSASSSSVYGANQKMPFEEVDKVDEPLTLYAATKKAGELMGHSYAHLWKIPVTAFRFFTVYGPWGRPDMALFKFVAAILKGEPIEIYGQGQMRRDFTYVDDLVEAVVRLIPVAPDEANRVTQEGVHDTLSPQGPYRVVNIGGGKPMGLLPFIDTIEAALGTVAIRKMLPMQKGDMPETYASPALLNALAGHVPATSVEQGVRSFVAWYRNYYQV